MQPIEKYKNATLSVEHTGMWRFSWYNTNPGTGQLERVRKTLDINRIEDLRQRRAKANEYIQLLNEALRRGYNFFNSVETNAALPGLRDLVQNEVAVLQPEPQITVLAALEKALKIRCLGKAHRTTGTYRSFVAVFTTWLQDNGLAMLDITSFTGEHWHEFMFYKSSLGHGNRNINDYTNFFKTTFDVVRKKMKLIKENPLAEVDYLPEKESTLFEPLTQEEIERIVPALIEFNPRFYLYTRFIAYEFIRPWHIARLKAGDITYSKDHIHVADETTKNRRSTYKQLLQPIKAMLQEMGYDNLPGTYYLFSDKNFEPGNRLYQNLSIRAAEHWKRIVIDGLGINKKMYALKHTSSQYYVNENDKADMNFLQHHMEHHSLTQTEIYLQGRVSKKIDEGKTNFIKY
jgi:integrase